MSDRRDRGAADALGLVLIAPAAIGLAVIVVALGQSVDTDARLRTAAEAAAQAAALERDVASAESAAQRLVDDMFADDSICDPSRPRATVRYEPAAGEPADGGALSGGLVAVTVGCGEPIDARGPDPVVAYATVDRFRADR